MRIPCIEERYDRRALSRRNGFHDGGKKSRRVLNQFQNVKLIEIKSHDIVYCSYSPYLLCTMHNGSDSGEIMKGQTTAPMSDHFVCSVKQWVVIQIT